MTEPNAIHNNSLLAQAKALENELPPYLRGEDLYQDPEEQYAEDER